MLKSIIAALVIMGSGFSSSSAQANTVTYSGAISNAVVYRRPSYSSPYTPASNCVDCGYQSEAFSVSLTGAYTFSVFSSSFPDHVGILYSDNFDPSQPMANFNGPFSYETYLSINSRTLSLLAGIQYYWVTSTDLGFTHDKCALGCSFTTQISGPGTITANVPEPATWMMMLIGFGGVGVALRARRAVAAAA